MGFEENEEEKKEEQGFLSRKTHLRSGRGTSKMGGERDQIK